MPTHSKNNSYVTLVASDHHALRAYVARPAGTPQGVIVLLQQMDRRSPGIQLNRSRLAAGNSLPGVNAFARQMALHFADDGFAVVAPSTFGRGRDSSDRCYAHDPGAHGPRMRQPLEPLDTQAVLLDVEAALLYARHLHPHAHVGIVGYCWGALLAWQAASRFRVIRAAACHYGGGMELPHERERQPLAPVLVHWPDDPRCMRPEGIAAFVAQSQAQGPQALVQHHRYAARHSFMQAGLVAYDEAAAATAYQRTRDFLRQQLAPSR